MPEKFLGAMMLLFLIIFPAYYILYCDWCVSILFCYAWTAGAFGGFSVVIWKKSRIGGIVFALLTMVILFLSLRYVTFMLVWGMAAFGGAIIIRNKKEVKQSPLRLVLWIFLIIGIFVLIQGSTAIYRMMHFRSVRPDQIESIVMRRNERQVVVSEPEQLKAILSGLQKSYAYMRNRESIPQEWKLTIQLKNGKEFLVRVGSSTKSYSDAVFIDILGGEYQSRALHKVLKPMLWPSENANEIEK